MSRRLAAIGKIRMHEHLKTVLLFRPVEPRAWPDMPPKELLGAHYASAGGRQENVDAALPMTGPTPADARAA